MKVYILELLIPINIFNSKQLTVFLPSKRYYEEIDGNLMKGIYAWSKKKSVINKFLSYRDASNYRGHVCDMSKEEFFIFKEKYSECKISKYRYVCNPDHYKDDMNTIREDNDSSDQWTELYTTQYEYVNCTDYLDENMFENGLVAKVNYRAFSPEFIEILDNLGYTTIFDTMYSNIEYGEEARDVANYQLSYGKTPLGNDIPATLYNETSALLLFYRFPILGSTMQYPTLE